MNFSKYCTHHILRFSYFTRLDKCLSVFYLLSFLVNVVFLKMSQISQDSAEVDAPASSIDSTSVLENQLLAKVNEPVAKVNVRMFHPLILAIGIALSIIILF